MDARVESTLQVTRSVRTYELRPAEAGRQFPPFTAGAHINLELPNGLVRSYSLVNAQGETHRYVITVALDRASRGGSRLIHETLRVGGVIRISEPRNNFPLAEHAAHSVLIAGGIGITPVYSMVQRLVALRASWELHYAARTLDDAPFAAELLRLGKKQVTVTFDHELGGAMLDIPRIVTSAAPEAHLYCCGPASMLAAFQATCAGRDPAHVHLERFSADEPSSSGGFSVVLSRSNRSIVIPSGKTILDALLDAEIEVAYSCGEGVCGTCETRVLAGVPDHRDAVLTDEERAAGKTMMICCSGSKTPELVLDL